MTALAGTATPASVGIADVFPESRSYRRPLLVGASVLGAVILALTAVDVVDWRFFRPQATLTAYFAALADRDGARAGRLLAGGGPEAAQETLDPAAMTSKDYTPPSGVRVGNVEIDENMATAQVSFVLGGERHETTMTLVRHPDRTAGLFHRWRIADGTYPISVHAPGVQSVVLAGVPVPIREGDSVASVRAFPGDYVARLPAQPLLTAVPVTVRAGVGVGEERAGGAEIEPTVAPTAEGEVERQVRSYLEECAKRTVLYPEGCPFSTSAFTFGQVTDVRWKITSYPSITVQLDPFGSGAVEVNTVARGRAEVTWQEVYLGTTDSENYEVTFDVDGTVVASGGAVTFQPT